MATVTMKTTENRIQAKLTSMVSKARDPRAFLNTVIFDIYKQAQLNRWMTENESETGRWKKLKTDYYQAYKKRKYRSFPGAGEKLMIAKGNLVDAAVGKKYLKKVVTTKGMILSIDDSSLPYAKYAAAIRPVMEFGPKTIEIMRKSISAYLLGG